MSHRAATRGANEDGTIELRCLDNSDADRTHPTAHEQSNSDAKQDRRGLILVLLGTCSFTCVAALSSAMTRHFAAVEIQLIRYLGLMVLSMAALRCCRIPGGVLGPRSTRGLVLLRSVLYSAHTMFMLEAFVRLRFDEATAILFSFPVWTMIFSYFVLNERISVCWVLSATAIVSALLLIVKPNKQQYQRLYGFLMAFLGSISFSLQVVCVKYTGPVVHWCQFEFLSGLVCTCVLCPIVALGIYLKASPSEFEMRQIWVTPSGLDVLKFVALGLGVFTSLGLITRGIQLSNVVLATMCMYLELPLTFLFQTLFFSDNENNQDLMDWIGMVVIVVSVITNMTVESLISPGNPIRQPFSPQILLSLATRALASPCENVRFCCYGESNSADNSIGGCVSVDESELKQQEDNPDDTDDVEGERFELSNKKGLALSLQDRDNDNEPLL